MILQVRNLGHRFDQGWLFRTVEIDLESSHRLMIKGRNGSGKSTFLKCLAGLLIPIEGTIQIPDSIGYAALDLSLYPNLTASEHLEFAAQLRNSNPQVNELLTQVGLDHKNSKPCRTYSTGMRARLKLALAIQHQPELLLLDEPTAALDSEGRDLIDSIMNSFDGAIIYASNDDNDARWATHAIEL
ncbi:MAG: ATP-binding cassette domain-containing protein [Fimbriimonadaceae bacterium]